MRTILAKVLTDSSGLVVTAQPGSARRFAASWVGLPFNIGGTVVSVESVQSPLQLTLTSAIAASQTNPLVMQATREGVYLAFYNRLVSSISGIATTTRSPQHWDRLLPEQTPSLFVEQVGENQLESDVGQAYKWIFKLGIGVFVRVGDPEATPPVTIINPINDQIEAALDPNQPTGFGLTLDGLVQEARLYGGDSRVAAGALHNIAWNYVPAILKVQ